MTVGTVQHYIHIGMKWPPVTTDTPSEHARGKHKKKKKNNADLLL